LAAQLLLAQESQDRARISATYLRESAVFQSDRRSRHLRRAVLVLINDLMASEDVLELTDSTFEAEILNSDVPALVDFWAVWCGPCKQIAPSVEALATEYKGKVKVGKLNIDDHMQVPQKYGIRSIPTLLVFKGGEVVGQIVGAVPQSKIEAELKKHM
jgi:thioredoxin 1